MVYKQLRRIPSIVLYLGFVFSFIFTLLFAHFSSVLTANDFSSYYF